MGAHADPDQRDLGNLVIGQHITGTQLFGNLLENLLCLGHFVAVNGEGEVRGTVGADVLDDHVYFNIGITDRAEDLVGDTRGVRHASQGQLGFVTGKGNSGNNRLFHINLFIDGDQGPGTLISVDEEVDMEKPVISGIAFTRDEAKLTLRGVPDTPGIAYKILGPIGDANIEVDMIVQNVGADGATDFTFTVHRNEMAKAKKILEQVAKELGARDVLADDKIAKVSLVGVGMRSHAGVASRMFQSLASEGVNIEMISTSEIKISVVIAEKYLELAVRALHAAFELDKPPG